MCSDSLIEILEKHIIRLFDNNGLEIPFNSIKIVKEKRRYSSITSLVLYVDNIALSGKQMKLYKVEYECRCKRKHIILLHKYIHKTQLVCHSCLQDKTFSDYFIIPNSKIHKGNTHNKKQKRNTIFENESEEFKCNFFKSHLTENEFYNYLQFIYKINDTIITDISQIKYCLFLINNQIKYSYKISFDNGNTFETIKSVWQKCSICGKIYKIHIYNLRNKDLEHIKCNKCIFNNYRYTIQLYDNSGLTYQSKPEKLFIDKCKENNIQIVNGLEIPYFFNKKHRTYISDFYLPEYKYIIEIKGNNIWYKNDIKSGKQQAKQNAAINFGKNYGISYKFVFDQNINDFVNQLLNERDSLGIGDNSGEIKSSQN